MKTFSDSRTAQSERKFLVDEENWGEMLALSATNEFFMMSVCGESVEFANADLTIIPGERSIAFHQGSQSDLAIRSFFRQLKSSSDHEATFPCESDDAIVTGRLIGGANRQQCPAWIQPLIAHFDERQQGGQEQEQEQQQREQKQEQQQDDQTQQQQRDKEEREQRLPRSRAA